jgi:hypothetical protein
VLGNLQSSFAFANAVDGERRLRARPVLVGRVPYRIDRWVRFARTGDMLCHDIFDRSHCVEQVIVFKGLRGCRCV